MSPGLAIFKKRQRFQRGTENLEPGPLPPEKRLIGPKERAGIYDLGEQSDEEYNKAYEEHERLLDQLDHTESDRPEYRMGPEDVYKTIGIEINGKEMEVPAVFDNMTDQDRAIIQILPHSQWPQYILDAIENTARDNLEQGMDVFGNRADEGDIPFTEPTPIPQNNYARGTSNVQHLQGGLELVNKLGYNPSKPTYGFGSGEPTRKGFGTIGSIAGNAIFPGLGFLTGPLTRGMVHLIQNMMANGASKQQIQQVVQQAQQQQGSDEDEPPPMPTGSVDLPQDKPAPHAGVGIDPWGNPADPGEWWSDDFGRWTGGDQFGTTPGDYNLRGPGGQFGTRGLGFTTGANVGGSGTVGNFSTAIGFGGPFGGGIGAGDTSRFASRAGYSRPYTEAQYNAPSSSHGTGQGPGYKLGPGWVPRASYAQYLQGFHPIGSVGSSTGPGGAAFQPFGPKGIGGGTPAFKPANQKAFAMGTSDVSQTRRGENPGLKFYQKKLLKKPKQKEQNT